MAAGISITRWTAAALVVALVVAALAALALMMRGEPGDAEAAEGCESSAVVPSPAANPGLVADCKALLAARDELRGTGSLNWSAETAIHRWNGVLITASAPRRVYAIRLAAWRLNGTIPAELGQLTALTRLELSHNKLTGPIPAELGALKRLGVLTLHKNALTGSIPAALGKLPQLSWLWVAGNELTGCVPPALRNVSVNDLATLGLPDCGGTAQTYTLTLTTPANGSLSATPASATLAAGTAVTVTATPADGYRLAAWGGDCAGTAADASCALTMNANKTVSATFGKRSAVTYTLTLAAPEHGSLSATPSGGTHASGTAVTVTATPADGYRLTAWGGDCAGTATDASCALTMIGNKTVSATFGKRAATYTLTLATPEHGSLSASPSGASHAAGTAVTVTATPADGYRLTAWGGACAGTSADASCALTMNADKTVSATFGKRAATYTLTLATPERGALIARPSGGSHAAGTVVTVTAIADDGYRLTAWGGDCAGTSAAAASCTLTMNAHRTVSATFGTRAASRPPAPELIAVATGKAGGILLEWTIDPAASVTGWQYRQRARRGWDGPWAWGAWTNVPGSTAATRSHLLTGQPSRWFHFEVRAVAGALTGPASARVEGGPAYIGADGIPQMLPGQIVEGGRAWRIHAGSTVIDVPAGTRLMASRGALSGGIVVVTFRDVESGSWQIVDIDSAQGVGREIVTPPAAQGAGGDAIRAASADGSVRDVGAIFDRIMASARLVPVK